MMRGGGAIAAVVLLVWGVAVAEAAPLKLTTQWKGPAMALEIYDGGSNNNFAHLAPAANVPGQQWRQDTGHAFMQLTNVLRGAKMCFGVIKTAGKLYNAVQLQPCNGSSDQDWLIRRESGWIRLVNVNGGECLDIISQGNQKGMAHVARCGDYQGQRWKME